MNKFIFITIVTALFFYTNILFAKVVVVNGLTHRHKVEAGMQYRGVITLQNTATDAKSVKLYTNDYGYNATGEIHYSFNDQQIRSNISWIDLNTNIIELAPEKTYDIHYTITVPDSLPLNGVYWSVIMVEPVKKIEPTQDAKGVEIKSLVRYAIQIVTTYSGEEANANLEFIDAKVVKQDSLRFLQVDILNTGELYHKVILNSEFYDAKSGLEKGVFKSSCLSLLPNNSKRFIIDISTIDLGTFKTILLADCDDDTIFGLNLDLSVTNE